MPPRRNAAQIAKAEDRKALKNTNTFTVTFEATEANIQRVAALLMFSGKPLPDLVYADVLLPGEEDDTPPATDACIDYDVVRRTLAGHLGTYVTRFGAEQARALLESFGAPRLTLIDQSQLLGLHAALETALK